jgi:hypothetical protein
MVTTTANATGTGKHPAITIVCQCIKAAQNGISVCGTLLITLRRHNFIVDVKLFYIVTKQT